MKRLPLILIFSIGLAGMVTLSAQDNLPSEQVQVIKNFEARLADANKLPVTPSLPPADTTTLRYNYRLQPKSLSLEYEAPTIRPLGIKTEKQDPGYDGLIQAGYGYPNAPYAYAGYRANPNKQLNLGASFRHLSMCYRPLAISLFLVISYYLLTHGLTLTFFNIFDILFIFFFFKQKTAYEID